MGFGRCHRHGGGGVDVQGIEMDMHRYIYTIPIPLGLDGFSLLLDRGCKVRHLLGHGDGIPLDL